MSNRLAEETSPYLLQHAHNPVDWYPWGDEALTVARDHDRPILLSIGYSACHWCHVMERESFEDAATAEVMNRSFVNIKVDREERPDIDSIYMSAVQAITGQGGWPLTAFLTPEGVPYYGGTYFPPHPRHGMPSFQQVLAAAANAYATRRGEVAAPGLNSGKSSPAARRSPTPAAASPARRTSASSSTPSRPRGARSTPGTADSGARPSFPSPSFWTSCSGAGPQGRTASRWRCIP